MKRLMIALLCLLLTAGVASAACAEELTNTEGYVEVARNDRFALFLNYEKEETLQFYVEDLTSGMRYDSSPEGWEDSSDRRNRMQVGSQLIVSSLDKVNTASYSANSQVSSVGEGGTVVTLMENGFRVDYDFPREKDLYKVPVVYTLEEEGLRVDLLMTAIEEYGDVYVESVALLPNFFAAEQGAEGYLLVPDGSGALIDFGGYRSGMSGYRQTVYGRDPSLTTTQQMGQSMSPALPVLGIHKGDAGVLIIADQGSALAVACGYPSGASTTYSSAWFEFTYRAVDKLTIADRTWYSTDVKMNNQHPNDREDVSVLYRFYAGEESGYVAMANLYRKYLMDKGMERQASSEPGMHLDLYGGVKKERSVLGVIVTDLMPMTTFEQTGEIVTSLREAGVTGLHVNLLGWNKGGLQDAVPAGVRPERRLGGEKALAALMAQAETLDVTVELDVDFLRFYKQSVTHNAFIGSAQAITGEAAAQYTYRVSTYLKNELIDPYYLLSPGEVPQTVAAFAQKLGGRKLFPSSLGEMVYSNYLYGGYVTREESLRLWQDALAELKARQGTVTVSGGKAWTLPYAGAVTNTPLMDSGYDVTKTDVPFYAIVLHGCLDLYAPAFNLSEEPDTLMLRLLETGVNPAFALTWAEASELRDTRYESLLSTQWSLQEESVKAVWETWRQAMAGLNGQLITDHRISGEARCTAYEDGTRVYVNYGWTDAVLDGVTVPARDYVIVKGGN